MRHLSKHYRAAEKEFIRLGEDFLKAVKLEKEAGRGLHKDVLRFEETLTDMIQKVEQFVGSRIETEEKRLSEEAEKRANAESDCPRCKAMVPVTITGEIKIAKTGYTHCMMKCKMCKKEFVEQFPKDDEELIEWQAAFMKQVRTKQPDGRLYTSR